MKIPPLLARDQRQFSTEQANESRLITKTRWIVEARIGHLKNIFKFFSRVISTSHVPRLNDFLRIAGAMINKYYGPVTLGGADVEMAENILIRSRDVNIVQARVEAMNLRGNRARWVLLTADHLPLFPRLPPDFLTDFTIGTYQLNLAPSYVQDSSLRHEINEIDEGEHQFEIDIKIITKKDFFEFAFILDFEMIRNIKSGLHLTQNIMLKTSKMKTTNQFSVTIAPVNLEQEH